MTIESVSVSEVYEAQQAGPIAFIDVREADEIAQIATPFAQNFPLSTFDLDAMAKEFAKDQPLYLMCKAGVRSMRAATLLANAGFTNLHNVEGGIMAWVEAGLPIKSS